MMRLTPWLTAALLLLSVPVLAAPRLVVIDQDGSGPGGSNQMAMIALLQAPEVEVLGISMVTGNAWMERETQHTLRMLELLGRADIPVYRGAVWPLVRDMDETIALQAHYGKIAWLGAWGERTLDAPADVHAPEFVPEMPEGAPSAEPQTEDAAHFLVRTVREHPGEVTIFAAGPLTNLALAQRIDPEFASLAKELVIMAGSLNPVTDDDEFSTSPQHEFNVWFDPEAAHIVFTAPWKSIVATTVDVSIKTWFSQDLVDAIGRHDSPAARYIATYDGDRYYMWDEIAAVAWLYPDVITATRELYWDVDLSHGPNYGHLLAWTDKIRPDRTGPKISAQVDLDRSAFEQRFVELIARTP